MKKIKTMTWVLAVCGVIILAAIISLNVSTSDLTFSPGKNVVTGFPGMGELASRDEVASSMPFPSPIPPIDGSGIEAGEHIIKTGTLDMRVQTIDEAVLGLNTIAEKYNGDVLSRSVNVYENETIGYVTLRVEASNFENAMLDAKALATFVTSEDVSTQDVTSTVIDLQARLTNARAEEQSYLAILERATTVEEILMVQNYLSQVRANIESYEGQLEYYTARTTYSTITVTLHEEGSVQLDSPTFRPLQAVIDATQTVVELAQAIVIGLVYIVIVGGAVAIPLLLIWIIWRAIKRAQSK